jgi:hypothetical protein
MIADRKCYEYKVVRIDRADDLTRLLNEHRADGWRFIQTY